MLAIEALLLFLLALGIFFIARKVNRWLAKRETTKPIENAEAALDSVDAAAQEVEAKEHELEEARKALAAFRKTHKINRA